MNEEAARASTQTGRCTCKLGITPVEISLTCPWHMKQAIDGVLPSPFVVVHPTPQIAIDHPSHYNIGKIEVIDAIEDWQLGFHLGNVVKYVARAQHKGTFLDDLKKARWYLDREIERHSGKEETKQS
jgi:Protein of unknwon function (DUF3310)